MEIGIVLVTYNRLSDLKKALDCYERQTLPPAFILVVDNCSTDGTGDYLASWKTHVGTCPRYLITEKENTGGAGGFHDGLKRAYHLGTEWIWVADDDAFPKDSALEELSGYYEGLPEEKQKEIAALCTSVINKGEYHTNHRERLRLRPWSVYWKGVPETEYTAPFEIDVFSYVGTVMRRSALKAAGLPIRSYFIYCDDIEHSLRMRKQGKLVCVPAAEVVHDTDGFDKKPFFWGYYYLRRNSLMTRRLHFPFRFLCKWVQCYHEEVICEKDPVKKKVMRTAHFDALRGKTGLHPVYRPGWKPYEN